MKPTAASVHGAPAGSASGNAVIDRLLSDGGRALSIARDRLHQPFTTDSPADAGRAQGRQIVEVAGAAHALPVSRPDVVSQIIPAAAGAPELVDA